jgi:C4-dicarboxylate-specific signal transduction histidine kinase
MTEHKINAPKISDNLKKIKETSFRIAKIILAMKGFVKTEPHSRPAAISLSKIFDEVYAIMAFRLNGTKTKLISDEINQSLNVLGNHILLTQVFVNLLNNAIDAIKDNQDKWIKVLVQETADKKMIQITVSDSGLGIPTEFQSRIFESLFTTKVKEGTGLGLSISKKIMTDFKGDLVLDTNAKNTTFIVTIPKA